jgi:hypothetical protein
MPLRKQIPAKTLPDLIKNHMIYDKFHQYEDEQCDNHYPANDMTDEEKQDYDFRLQVEERYQANKLKSSLS